MRLLDIDWPRFFSTLSLYQTLPAGARHLLAESIQPSAPASFETLGAWRNALIDSGFLVSGPKNKNARVDSKFQEFSRALRSFHRSRIFQAPSRESFSEYVNEHLSGDEIRWLPGDPNANYYAYHNSGMERLFALTASGEWLLDFLAAQDTQWETAHQNRGTLQYFREAEILEATQDLVNILIEAGEPVALSDLAALLADSPSEATPNMVAAAVGAGIRYLLFFPALAGEALEPVIGVWPGAARRLNAAAQEPPSPVSVAESFSAVFLVDDMTAILSQAAIDPLRLRSGDGLIFEARKREIVATLGSLPEFMERVSSWAPEERFSLAIIFLDRYDFLAAKQENRGGFRLCVTESGAAWLDLGAKERLKAILNGLRDAPKRSSSNFDDHAITLIPGTEDFSYAGNLAKVSSPALAAYAGTRADEFVRMREFVAYHTTTENPLPAILRGRNAGIYYQGRHYVAPSPDETERIWESLLSTFFRQRLLPLGGVKVGEDAAGELCFALTSAGRYLLGAAEDFEIGADVAGQIVVQPNFDVVFLAPSGKAESEIARFAERKGRHLGTLFRITKASIQTAAAAGFTRERVLQALQEHGTSALPKNVEREITGWFRQYREVAVRHAMLIHCPDEETATRVLGAAGKHVTRLSPTMLELHSAKPNPALLRKLREAGIFWRT